jgi:hypothetical protein
MTGVNGGVQDGYVHLGSSPYATWTYGDNQCTAYTSLTAPLQAPLPASWTARLATHCPGSPVGPLRGLPCPPGRPATPGAGRPTTGQPGALLGRWPRGACWRLACGRARGGGPTARQPWSGGGWRDQGRPSAAGPPGESGAWACRGGRALWMAWAHADGTLGAGGRVSRDSCYGAWTAKKLRSQGKSDHKGSGQGRGDVLQ